MPFKVLCVVLFEGTLTPTFIYLVQQAGLLASADRAREFLLPLILTVAFLPYFYLVRMVVAWQTALSMLEDQMEERPLLLKAARRALIRSCHASLPRIQLFEPEFRWRLGAATSEEDIQRTIGDFNDAAAARPSRERRVAEEKSGVRVLLPGAGGSNIFVRSIALADSVQTALASAAMARGCTQAEMSELLYRLNALNDLERCERGFARRSNPNTRAGPLNQRNRSDRTGAGQAFDHARFRDRPSWPVISTRFSTWPVCKRPRSPRIAAELHTMSAVAGLSLSDALSGLRDSPRRTVTDEDQRSADG